MLVVGSGDLYAAAICATTRGPGWLSLTVPLLIWNALKTLWTGPFSLIRLAPSTFQQRVRGHRYTQARRQAL